MKIDVTKLNLKDIHLKDLKDRKELLVLLAIVIFVIAFLLIGNSLLTENGKVNDELNRVKNKYEAILRKENSVQVLSSKISEMHSKILRSEKSTGKIDEMEIIGILDEMQKTLGITWESKNRTISEATSLKDAEGIEKFKVTINGISMDYEKAKNVMTYVENLEQLASVESISISKNAYTGEYRGNMVLNFYMQE